MKPDNYIILLLYYYVVAIQCNAVRVEAHCCVHYDLVISKQSFDSEPHNPQCFWETALCPIGLSTTDLNVFNKTDTVDIRSTLCHRQCSKKNQMWVGELFTLSFSELLKGSSMHLSNTIVHYLTSFYPVLSYSDQDSCARSIALPHTQMSGQRANKPEKLVMESVYSE